MDPLISTSLMDFDEPRSTAFAMVHINQEGPADFQECSSIVSVKDENQIHLSIKEDLIRPLRIIVDTSCDLLLTLANGIKGAVLLDIKSANKIHVRLNQGAQLNLYLFIDSDQALLPTSHIYVDQKAEVSIFDIGIFADKTHRTIDIELVGAEAKVRYFGLDQLNGEAKKTSLLTIYHRNPNTHSKQIFRGIYADRAQGTFFGKVVVDKHAHECEAKQLYKAILLGERAKAHVMPQLEINNSDIMASHGASIGELDYDALHYLCSRGLTKEEAQSLLVESLLNDILDEIEDPSIRQFLELQLERSIERSLVQVR